MKILYKYLIREVFTITLIALACLTFGLVLVNVFQKVSDIFINHDVPLGLILQLVILLIPFSFTFSLPLSLLAAVMLTFGRLSHDLELLSIRAAGIGLIPYIAPVILLSLLMSLLCFYNNAVLAPTAYRAFKLKLIDIGRNNPTMLLRAQEPIDTFPGYRIWIGEKQGNQIKDVHIWQLDDNNMPQRSIRADHGELTADLNEFYVKISLTNARQEIRGSDPTQLNLINTGMKAKQLPMKISLDYLKNRGNYRGNKSVQTIMELSQSIENLETSKKQLMPTLTEIQKRVAFSFAPFTFVLVGIPLAIYAHRRETSTGLVLVLGIAVVYYLLIVIATSYKHQAEAYPELIMWVPNIIFQSLGFYLLWKVNRHPL